MAEYKIELLNIYFELFFLIFKLLPMLSPMKGFKLEMKDKFLKIEFKSTAILLLQLSGQTFKHNEVRYSPDFHTQFNHDETVMMRLICNNLMSVIQQSRG